MRPLTIGIDYRPALSRMTGVGRYVEGLVAGLSRIDAENRYVLFSSSLRERLPRLELPGNFECVDRFLPVSLLNVLWHRFGLPTLDFLTGERLDVAHSPYPLLVPSRGARSIVTIHDLYFLRHPEATSREIRRDYVPLVGAHARRADAVITDCEATADEVERELGVARDRIAVIPLGVDHASFGTETTLGDAGSPYVLAVATREPRKNLPRLVEAIGLLVRRGWEGRLIMAGAPGGDDVRIEESIDRFALQDRVKRLGYVPPADLPVLYGRAKLVVLASLGEGFGLPLLEAMAARVPIVASDVPAHREVAAEAAFYIDPHDPASIACGIETVWQDRDLTDRLVRAGADRVKLFSWEETARRTLAVYRRLGAIA